MHEGFAAFCTFWWVHLRHATCNSLLAKSWREDGRFSVAGVAVALADAVAAVVVTVAVAVLRCWVGLLWAYGGPMVGLWWAYGEPMVALFATCSLLLLAGVNFCPVPNARNPRSGPLHLVHIYIYTYIYIYIHIHIC